jgi:hypothetical protein
MANVNDYPVTNGDLIGDDNQIDNIVDLLGGGTPVSNQTLNKNDFPIHSSLVIGSDNKVYDLKDLIGSPIDPDDFIPNEGNTLENENFYLGRDNMSFTTQRTFEVESDNGGELSVNNGVDITSTDGSTLNVGRNIEATADGNVVLTSGDDSSITLSDDIVFVANDTTAMTINDETISVEEDIQTTITEFENNSLVTKQYVSDNTINESIVDVNVLPTGSNIKDVVYRLASTVGQETTYSYYMGDSTNQTTTELSGGSNDVICTQAQYNALPSSKLTDGVSYYITDVNNIQNGNNISW